MSITTAFTRLTAATAHLDTLEQLEFLAQHHIYLRRLVNAGGAATAAWAAAWSEVNPGPMAGLLVALRELVPPGDRYLLICEAWGRTYRLDLRDGVFERDGVFVYVDVVARDAFGFVEELQVFEAPRRAQPGDLVNVHPATPHY